MVNRDDLRDRLDNLEETFGLGSTALVVVGGDGGEWPEGVTRADIERRVVVEDPADPIDEYAEVLVPFHRPSKYRGGVVVMSPAEIATVYDTMPDDIRERELEHRLKNGEPIPPILQT